MPASGMELELASALELFSSYHRTMGLGSACLPCTYHSSYPKFLLLFCPCTHGDSDSRTNWMHIDSNFDMLHNNKLCPRLVVVVVLEMAVEVAVGQEKVSPLCMHCNLRPMFL